MLTECVGLETKTNNTEPTIWTFWEWSCSVEQTEPSEKMKRFYKKNPPPYGTILIWKFGTSMLGSVLKSWILGLGTVLGTSWGRSPQSCSGSPAPRHTPTSPSSRGRLLPSFLFSAEASCRRRSPATKETNEKMRSLVCCFTFNQSCGSGSVCFWASWIRIY